MNIKNVKHIRKSICKGCLTYESMDKDIVCKLPHKKNGHPCPCSTCLIKSVCIRSCDLIEAGSGVMSRLYGTSGTNGTSGSSGSKCEIDPKDIYREGEYDPKGQPGSRRNCKIRQPKMPWDSLC